MNSHGFNERGRISRSLFEISCKEQYLVPYFISGFPGTTHEKMEKVYDYMNEKGWKLQQVQAFIPTPMTLATAMYWTGIDPMTKKELFVAKEWNDRKIQQALLQPHKPEHREILRRYRQQQRRRDIEGGVKSDHGTCDPRSPLKPHKTIAPRARTVDVPKHKLGPQFLLDQR